MNMEEKQLELRMYFFVPYNIAPIQHGIQAGHALGRYILKYGKDNPDHIGWYFLEHHETWIILNGGTTNSRWDENAIPLGTLDQIQYDLRDNKIDHTAFLEPDLNDALTAVCFIADERVWNYKDYPTFSDYIINSTGGEMSSQKIVEIKITPEEELKLIYKGHYEAWLRKIGGPKNVFLRELIKGKKESIK
jgi:hypothetical protein